MYAPLDLDDVQYADVVVVGTIPTTASSLIPMYASAINRSSPETLNLTKQPRSRQASFPISPISDRGRWGLAGGEPKSLPSGPFLIALRDPHSRIPPLRAVSATVSPNPELGALTLLQAPCARPFLFSVDSKEAHLLREKLAPLDQR